MTKLTERQSEILAFIRESIISRQRPPTLREIMERFGFGSPNGVVCHLKALVAKGVIFLDEKHACGIRLAKVRVVLEDVE